MWGAATHDRSTGIHRPLTATAFVLEPSSGDASQRQVFVAVDHCLLWAEEMQQVRDAILAESDLSPEQVIVVFSHTHAAGLMGLERTELPGGDLIPPYLTELGKKLAQVVCEAIANTQPARLTYGTGHCNLAGHRDTHDPDSDQWVCGFNPDGPVDDAVLVARVTSEDGSLLATLVNYACHPTTLAWDNTLISPDFPGAMREVIEEATGQPCIFLQGAAGDVGPRDGFVGDVATADSNGRQLGYAALVALEALPEAGTRFEYLGPVISGATIGTWGHRRLTDEEQTPLSIFQVERFDVALPYPDDRLTAADLRAERAALLAAEDAAREAGDLDKASDLRALVERKTRALVRVVALPDGDAFPFPVTLLKTGTAIWIVVEGEPYQALQRTLRERFPDEPILVLELANGSRCSYLPPAEIYGKGIYQESIAVLAAGCLEKLTDAISERITALVN
jgi:hypothetical protein